jgi:hypothetical protein
VNVPQTDGTPGVVLGNYPSLKNQDDYTLEELQNDIANKQSVEVRFTETSRDNNILCQLFEVSNSGINKLSIVDFRTFDDDADISTPPLHVFFLGHIIKDTNGSETFFNVFTVIAE